MRGYVPSVMICLLFTQLEGVNDAAAAIMHCGKDVGDNLVAIQKLLKLGNAVQELRISPEGATEVKPPSDWPQKGSVTFKNVKLRYRPETALVLTDLSYTAEAGHKVGIVGRTGCGKSTMGLALSRLVEIEGGLVSIDGVEVSKVDLTLLRSKITVIPQDPVIF